MSKLCKIKGTLSHYMQMFKLKVRRHSFVVKGVLWWLDIAVLKNKYGVAASGSATDHFECFKNLAAEIFVYQYACLCVCMYAHFKVLVLSYNGFALQINETV